VAVQHAAALAPVIAGLQEEITVLRRELDQQRLQAAVAEQEMEGLTSRINEVCVRQPSTAQLMPCSGHGFLLSCRQLMYLLYVGPLGCISV